MKKIVLVLISVLFFTSLYSQDSKILKSHTSDINALAFSNDGKYLYSGGDDEKLITWDLSSMKIFKSNNIGMKIFKIIPLPKNDELYLVLTKRIGLFNTLSSKIISGIDFSDGYLNVEYMPISNKIFTFYDLVTETISGGSSTEYEDNDYTISVCNTNDYKLNPKKLFNVRFSYKRDISKDGSKSTSFGYSTVTISKNEKYYAFIYFEREVISDEKVSIDLPYPVININSLKDNSLTWKKRIGAINNKEEEGVIKFDNNGENLFYLNSEDYDMIFTFNTINGLQNSFKGHEKRILCMDVHPSNLYLASGSKDNTIIIWDIQKHKALNVLKGHEDNVRSIAFSKDGRYLATGSDDKTIRVWDISNLTNEIKEYALKYDKEVGLAVLTNQEMDKELKAIESKFSPKGEFETTDAYNKRLEDANAEKKSIEDKYNQQLDDARQLKETEIKGFTSEVQNETQRTINESVRDTVLKIDKIGTYNADNETFSLTIIFMTENIKIPSSDAVEFKQNYKKAVVRAKKKLNSSLSGWEYFDIYIINPNNNTEYKFK